MTTSVPFKISSSKPVGFFLQLRKYTSFYICIYNITHGCIHDIYIHYMHDHTNIIDSK